MRSKQGGRSSVPPGCWPRRSGCRFCRAGQWDVRHRRACACRAPTRDPDAGRCLAAGPTGARRCRPGAAWVSRGGRCSGRGRWQGLAAGVIAGPTTWLLLQQAAHQLQAVSANDNQVRARRQAAQLQLVCLPTGQPCQPRLRRRQPRAGRTGPGWCGPMPGSETDQVLRPRTPRPAPG